MKKTKWMLVLLVVLLGLGLVACGDDDDDDDYSSSKKKKKEPTETVEEVTPTETVTGYPAQNPDYDGPGSDGDVTATPTPEATPTEEVTPEPTPEVKKDYDPEIVVEHDDLETAYSKFEWIMYEINPTCFKVRHINVKDKDGRWVDLNILDKSWFEEHNLYYHQYISLLLPIPWEKETIYMKTPAKVTSDGYSSVCVVFVKEDEDFNMNDLLAQARKEKGTDYTLDEMITSKYSNILFWNGFNWITGHLVFDMEEDLYCEVNIKQVFPEQGLYKACVYKYYEDTQEWHRVKNEIIDDRMKYDVVDYDSLGLMLEFVE